MIGHRNGMSAGQRLRSRLRRWALHRWAVPLVNRELKEQGVVLYRYIAATDRLFPYKALNQAALSPAGEILSDHWYRALQARKLRGKVAFDVGVNYGYTSAWLSRWAERVYSFEPNPNNAAMIREQLRIRRIDNVEHIQTAISDHAGEGVLHVKPFDGHHSLADIGASSTVSTMPVPLTTLDRFAQERRIEQVSLLKIDVEGFEPEVLHGARGLLSARAIDLILFEYSPRFYRQRRLDPRAPIAVLEQYGYQAKTLQGHPLDPESTSTFQQIDLLAEPPSPRRQRMGASSADGAQREPVDAMQPCEPE
ncbi:MAG TPA: FkbM family methyltransferase [Polyangiales bacterium]